MALVLKVLTTSFPRAILRCQNTMRYLHTKGNTMNIDQETYDQIAELIHSDESPVGIDAKKTHILILHKLGQIEKRLDALGQQSSDE